MKTAKITFEKGFILILSIALLLNSCKFSNPTNKVIFHFRGDQTYLAESNKYVYFVSYESAETSNDATYFISSFKKNGEKNWEKRVRTNGEIYPLKDGRFFYASKDGIIFAYDKKGSEVWKLEVDIAKNSNSNFLLNTNEELLVNLSSSPSNSTTYCIIDIDKNKTILHEITNLATTFTYNYPSGGYITTGFTSDYKRSISKISKDFVVEWTYSIKNDEGNLKINDISHDGKILFSGTKSNTINVFLRELNSNGKELNSSEYQNESITAAYFQDKIVISADKLRVLNFDFSVEAQFDKLIFARIKTFENSFFVFNQGSYKSGSSVIFDGYCNQYENNNNLIMDKVFKGSEGFIGIGENGKLYYRK